MSRTAEDGGDNRGWWGSGLANESEIQLVNYSGRYSTHFAFITKKKRKKTLAKSMRITKLPLLCWNLADRASFKFVGLFCFVLSLQKMWIFGRKGPSGFSASSTAEEVTNGIDGTDLTAIVTGSSSGIGVETTRVLALRGVHVIMAVRNMDAGRNVKEQVLKEIPNAKIDVMQLDLSSMGSVRKFASDYNESGLPLNLLINNAGVIVRQFKLSQDNIELQFATNHLGHFLLTNLLLETMKKTARERNKEGRIINVSSEAHRFVFREGICFDKINDESGYNMCYAYGKSKLANILHANELARCLKEEGGEITANSLHPGAIGTNFLRVHRFIYVIASTLCKYVLKSVHQGAATQCYLALHPQVKGVSGEYFMDSNKAKASSRATDAELAKKLWDISLSLTSQN